MDYNKFLEQNFKKFRGIEMKKEVGKIAKERVLREFDWEKIIKEYLGVLGG